MDQENQTRELALGTKLQRSFSLGRAEIDEDSRSVTLSYASQEPVERWYRGEVIEEVIDIKKSDYGRMNGGAPLLVNHDPDQQVGVVTKSWVDKNDAGEPVARATVKFSQSAKATEIWQDVKDGIRGNTSVGYELFQELRREERDGAPPRVYFSGNFLEASLVAVPADNTVGVGREKPETVEKVEPKESKRVMSEENKPEAAPTPEVRVLNEPTPEQRKKFEEGGAERERKRISDIEAAARQLASYSGIETIAQEAKREGWSVERANDAFLQAIGNGSVETRDFGLSKTEKRQYSIQRALGCMLNNREVDGIEGEVSRAFQESIGGKEPTGMWIPFNLGLGKVRQAARHWDVRTTLTTVAATNGEDLYPDVHRGDLFVEALRPMLFMESLGANIINIATPGALSIPRFTSTSALTWQTEATATTESEPETDTIPLRPYEGSTFTAMSKRLIQHSDPGVEGLIRQELTRTVGQGLDTAFYSGSGTNRPTGVETAASGIWSTATNASPTRAEVLNAEADLADANSLFGDSIYFVAPPAMRENMRNTQEDSGSGRFLWSDDNTVIGYPAVATTLATAATAVLGRFEDYLGVIFGGVDLLVDQYSQAANRIVRIHVNVMADGDARHDASFSKNA